MTCVSSGIFVGYSLVDLEAALRHEEPGGRSGATLLLQQRVGAHGLPRPKVASGEQEERLLRAN